MDTIILPEPIKSQSDEKQYRHLKLGNGLQALLISDATLDGDDNESVDFSSGKLQQISLCFEMVCTNSLIC